MEKISVIVPVYNGEAYLTACIESILAQEMKDNLFHMEIIIINDGSTDKTADICGSLQSKHSIIQVIHMNDEGVSAARNAALLKVTGDYVTFVDADDRLLPGMLSGLLETAIRTDSDITGCGYVVWSGEEEWSRLSANSGAEPLGSISYKETSYAGMEFIDKGILNSDTRCWSKLFKRETIKNVKFKEGLSIGEDMLFLLNAVLKAGKITISHYKGYGYFQNPQGVMNRIFKDSYMDQITCWQLASEQIREIRPDLNYKAAGILMVSVMLTVGKIAELPRGLRELHRDKIKYCREQLGEAKKTRGSYASLSTGYKVKVTVFCFSPGFYVSFYPHLRAKARTQINS